MKPSSPIILILNGGSSSIRFSVYQLRTMLERQLHGKLERIGLENPILSFRKTEDKPGVAQERVCSIATDYPSAVEELMHFFAEQEIFKNASAIGHRIVHGMQHMSPEIVTPPLVEDFRRMAWVDPDHLPIEVALIEALRRRLPTMPQVACFDTAFHQHMPQVATMLAIPRRFAAKGIQRYGFHGLSYAYLMEELERAAGASVAQGRVVLAHLGNGASMVAVKDGHSIDTSMGFTPAGGLVMGSRSGDIDPGLASYLERSEQMTAWQFDAMVNHESGLLGISETSSDMRDLLASEASDSRAAEAIALFCYQSKKQIGAYAAALGGLETLVFSGGIGENGAIVRARICAGLEFLGIHVDATRNAANAEVISSDDSVVTVWVIPTDEELMIARSVCRVLGYTSPTGEVQP